MRRIIFIAALCLAAAGAVYTTGAAALVDTAGDGPASASISQTIGSGSTLSGTVNWQAYPDGGPRAHVDFFVDGVLKATQNASPYCYGGDQTCAIDTRSLADGEHAFKVVYLNAANGKELASDTATASVDNSTTSGGGTTGSWNPYVNGWSVVQTTVAELEGNGTEAGGGFPNHLTDDYPKSLTPGQPIPSEIPSSAALVEIDNLTTTPITQPYGAGIGDGDGVDNLVDPATGLKLHSEISREWGTIKLADGTIRGPFLDPYPAQTVWPAAGTHIDVQGFVSWDDHNGWWELHPVSAWRIHSTGASTTGTTTSIQPQTLQGSIAAHQREEAREGAAGTD
jgi:hypothetical protein